MIVRDPVHDLVRFESEEEHIIPALLDTPEVQRLRRIRQLGVTHLVFPGAEHSRFTHAIGAAHVMTKLIRRIREMDHELPFWQRLTSDRAQDALVAALLHDVGHGPYSHLFEQALPNAPKHESWSLAVVNDPSTRVHQVLVQHDTGLPERVASLIAGGHHEEPYPIAYLAHAVSGFIDVDRCDYLLRDAYMTGVRYGLFDLDWLLRSLRLGLSLPSQAPHLAIDGAKGIPAVEGFVIARRFMFEQVYLHKATRAAETMIKAIFARVAQNIINGDKLDFVPKAIHNASLGQPIALREYLALDDISIGAALAAWEQAKDPVLSDLCQRIRNRRLAKTIELVDEDAEELKRNQKLEEARELATTLGLDPQAHVALDIAEDKGSLFELNEPQALEVIFSNHKIQPVLKTSSLLQQLYKAPIRRVRLIIAPEIRELLE